VSAPTPQPPVFSKPLDILLVEDNEINRIVVRGMLAKSSHHVTGACDGHEGIATTQTRAFDVILMDISMPGMDCVLRPELSVTAPVLGPAVRPD